MWVRSLHIMARAGGIGLMFACSLWAAWGHRGILCIFTFLVGYWFALGLASKTEGDRNG